MDASRPHEQHGSGIVPVAPGRGVLDGAFRVLRALPDVDPRGQVSAVARATGIPRPSVHRILRQLVDVGAVARVGERYVLAPDLLRLAGRAEPVAGLRRASNGVLEALREQTGSTVSLVSVGVTSPVALRILPGREAFPVSVHDGMAMPETAAAAVVLEPRRDLSRFDERHRAAVDDEHCFPGMTCYAAAVPLPGGAVAALQVASMSERSATRFAPFVHHAAGLISSRLTAPPLPAGG